MGYLRPKVCLERRWHVESGAVHGGALGESLGGAIIPSALAGQGSLAREQFGNLWG